YAILPSYRRIPARDGGSSPSRPAIGGCRLSGPTLPARRLQAMPRSIPPRLHASCVSSRATDARTSSRRGTTPKELVVTQRATGARKTAQHFGSIGAWLAAFDVAFVAFVAEGDQKSTLPTRHQS